MSTNKFLGINSINVLKQYIDEQILLNENSTRLVTLQVYKYIPNGDIIDMPSGGSFDPAGAGIIWPANDWKSLQSVVNTLGIDPETGDFNYSLVSDKLRIGSIYMSAGVADGGINFGNNWSNPIKISGENGVTVEFAYAYSQNTPETQRTKYPRGVDSYNTKEYVWMNYNNEGWIGPSLWACFAKNGTDMMYRYRTTATIEEMNGNRGPSHDADPNWTTNISQSLSNEFPYMWMSWKRVSATEEPDVTFNESAWSEPILFGHFAKDGVNGQDGLDGNIPSYSRTLYAITSGDKPEFICNIGDNIDDVIEVNSDIWSDIPEAGDESNIWWYIVVNINGGDRENPDAINTVKSFSQVMRFSAINGEQLSTTYTKYLYCWSNNQSCPTEDAEWIETPVFNEADQDGSLWMKTGIFKFNAITNETELVNEWTNPVKLTGPRGPISFDYRTESVFGAGTADIPPKSWKSFSEVRLTDTVPYIWEKRYIAIYKMKYADTPNEDGSYDIVEDKFLKTIGEPDVFRISGINGQHGEVGENGKNCNRLNDIDYATSDKNLNISNFDDINYFIANSSEDVHYTLNGNKFGDFESGYTGKFVNICLCNMIINTINAMIVGSCTDTNEIILKPQESIELISFNNNGICEFILIGKSLQKTEPTTNPDENTDLEAGLPEIE